jgi:hypothetical protein
VKRLLRRAAIALGLIALVMAGGVTSAHAADGSSRVTGAGVVQPLATCGTTHVCVWARINYLGSKYETGRNQSNYHNVSAGSDCTKDPGTLNDCISSVANYGTSCVVYLHVDSGYRGRYHRVGLGDAVPNFASPPPTGYGDPSFNDQISSHHWCTPS